jgi:hypothetical protein
VCGRIPLDLTQTGHATITRTLTLITECSALTTLAIDINEHKLFWNDQVGLEAFIQQGLTFVSKGILALQKVL